MEKWLPVLGFEGSYEVSDLGRVRSIDKYCTVRGEGKRLRKGRILTPRIRRGYNIVNLTDKSKAKSVRVSRAVLEAFVGPQPSLVARHLDGNKNNNALTNLAWGTAKQNEADKDLHGTRPVGSKVWTAKLTEEDVLNIRNLLASGISQLAIAERYHLSPSTINAIHTRTTWKHI